MSPPRLLGRLLALVAVVLLALPASARAVELADYFGSYVGRAVDIAVDSGRKEQRDIDIVISPLKNDGFQIEWVNVTLVDGRRDVPGVRRRPSAVAFMPNKARGLYVETSQFNPFKVRDDLEPMKGQPVRWAALDAGGLHVYAFVLLEDGSYEMQTYTRRLTADGLELTFERVVDGTVVRRMTGHAVRAD
ncbi:MAG: hypothetical protein U1E14_14135 [Geminicoccaceae bacterium]